MMYNVERQPTSVAEVQLSGPNLESNSKLVASTAGLAVLFANDLVKKL